MNGEMLFDCSTDNIGLHPKNIFASGELEKDSVAEKFSATESNKKNYLTQFYNIDGNMTNGGQHIVRPPFVCVIY